MGILSVLLQAINISARGNGHDGIKRGSTVTVRSHFFTLRKETKKDKNVQITIRSHLDRDGQCAAITADAGRHVQAVESGPQV